VLQSPARGEEVFVLSASSDHLGDEGRKECEGRKEGEGRRKGEKKEGM
jgi:hypothetical protein